MYLGHRKGCGQTSGRETWCLEMLRSGDGFVQRTEKREVRKTKTKRE
jgi:hypothetical protein